MEDPCNPICERILAKCNPSRTSRKFIVPYNRNPVVTALWDQIGFEIQINIDDSSILYTIKK